VRACDPLLARANRPVGLTRVRNEKTIEGHFARLLRASAMRGLDVSSESVPDDSISFLRRTSSSRQATTLLVALSSLLGSVPALAQDAVPPSVAALPGSPRPIGPGLSPEAPHSAPAAGGRAPSFGAPTKKDTWAFQIGGSIYAWEAVGIGTRPDTPAPNQLSSPIFHVPALIEGRQPFGTSTGGSLFMQYGNAVVSATVNAVFNATGKERQGFYNANSGPAMSSAYLTVNPQLGQLQLQLRLGAFTENFAGPGQWGWGLFGPMLATRGYGFAAIGQYPLNDELLSTFEVALQGVPGVPENFVRGEYTGWLETGISSLVTHAHAGLVYQNQYTVRLHYAHAWGFDDRQYLVEEPSDGSIDVLLLETRYMASPFGQLGVTFGFWNFNDANHVHDGIWWGLDWTKGGTDMMRDYVGLGGLPTGLCNVTDPANAPILSEQFPPLVVVPGEPFPCTGSPNLETPVLIPNGDGKLFAVSAEYDTSLAQHLWHPRPFNGTAPDIRLALAATAHWTLESGDPAFSGASGFLLGALIEYQMLPWFSVPLRFFGEDRDFQYGRYQVYSISPGIAFRTDWQSTDRIELIYSRRFYNSGADDNAARPLDPHVLTVGANINF
jgi:hypothetical protein